MVQIRNSQNRRRVDTRRLRVIVGSVLADLGLAERDLNILLVDNRAITAMNERFFGRPRATNVISFSYLDGLPGEALGDIIVSVERAGEEAARSAMPFHERLLALIIHGIVHILGFDHEQGEREARRMRYRERRLMTLAKAHPAYEKMIESAGQRATSEKTVTP